MAAAMLCQPHSLPRLRKPKAACNAKAVRPVWRMAKKAAMTKAVDVRVDAKTDVTDAAVSVVAAVVVSVPSVVNAASAVKTAKHVASAGNAPSAESVVNVVNAAIVVSVALIVQHARKPQALQKA